MTKSVTLTTCHMINYHVHYGEGISDTVSIVANTPDEAIELLVIEGWIKSNQVLRVSEGFTPTDPAQIFSYKRDIKRIRTYGSRLPVIPWDTPMPSPKPYDPVKVGNVPGDKSYNYDNEIYNLDRINSSLEDEYGHR